MLRTRLWMGAILILLVIGVLVVDGWLAPYYPFLLVVVLGSALAACWELRSLLDAARRPSAAFCFSAVAALALTNWVVNVFLPDAPPWTWIAGVFAAVVLAAFLEEMAVFQAPGNSVVRMALGIFIAAYLGLLPCFLAQLRWLDDNRGTSAVALAIFVPKMCDTGAYFTGRLLGRHKMAPTLSPKKTLEGAAGGLALAVVATIVIDHLAPVLTGGIAVQVGFGLTVGLTGLFGDLAESLIKRDCQAKDASAVMPGFGGVLDVVDSIVFAAPVAHWWLR